MSTPSLGPVTTTVKLRVVLHALTVPLRVLLEGASVVEAAAAITADGAAALQPLVLLCSPIRLSQPTTLLLLVLTLPPALVLVLVPMLLPVPMDSAALLNGIQGLIRASALSNYYSHPTNCPSREKRGWTGDGGHAAETLMFNFDMSSAYRKWLDDIVHASMPLQTEAERRHIRDWRE
jgi:hypothetical protein